MEHLALLINTVQNYAWGSKTAIPELLGRRPDGKPQAELWMGAHPKAPSSVDLGGTVVSLKELIERCPDAVLGSACARKYGDRLPFLLKALAAEKPLSIQAHPDARQAREGFLRETAAGIPLDADNRSYKDGNHKPECICALTPFWALNGFRKIPEILSFIGRICPDTMSRELSILNDSRNHPGLKRFFEALMTRQKDDVLPVIEETVRRAKTFRTEDPVFSWILRLHDAYPQDMGILSPTFLNLVRLEPGEAMFLSAGCLHAYLEGVGIELMANSDNVLRGGLTPKYVDVPELMKVLHFEETTMNILLPLEAAPGVRTYKTTAEEFELSEISVKPDCIYNSPEERSVEILFCTRGEATIFETRSKVEIHMTKGASVLIPASVKGYGIEGDSVFYRASVGIQ